jgi:hypothetical protein
MGDVISRAEPHSHFVQFYRADEPSLNRNVGSFLWDALLRGDGLVVIASEVRREGLADHLGRLGADIALARRERQLVMLDAQETLGRFMVDGKPDRELFQETVAEALRLVEPRASHAGISLYGEMVGVLWAAGKTAEAILLEQYWNYTLHSIPGLRLFCGYPIDVFHREFAGSEVRDVLCTHSELVSAGPNGDIAEAVGVGIDEVLGGRAGEIRLAMRENGDTADLALPAGESAILWLRQNAPEEAEGILECARSHYEAARTKFCTADADGSTLLAAG